MSIKTIEQWGLGLSTPLWVAGPCSAESKEQIEKISHGLKGSGVQLFRAGIWKPRTRPNSFEGVGVEALDWMQIPKEVLQIPVCIEVANANHVDAALKGGIDVLWIGARTTVNPFSVQEICDALKGTDVPVMVKNPINPDLNLWIGAIERLQNVGLTKIAGIHRGCSNNVPSRFRNNPEWSIPIHLKRLFPTMTVISDPSHIAGNRNTVSEVAQSALNFGLDGLMVETHNNPDEAWSDAKQQITPEELKQMLITIQVRHTLEELPEAKNELDLLRQNVDVLDNQIIEALAQRFETIRNIGEYKQQRNLAVFQRDRWNDVIGSRVEQATNLNISEKFITDILMDIHEESIRLQESMMHQKDTQKTVQKTR